MQHCCYQQGQIVALGLTLRGKSLAQFLDEAFGLPCDAANHPKTVPKRADSFNTLVSYTVREFRNGSMRGGLSVK
jgi:hypothetical protein